MDKVKLEQISTALWDRTKTDWELSINHSLTEPTCPTAIIRAENNKLLKWQYWRADCDTIDGAIDAVIDLAYRALFEDSTDAGIPWTEAKLKKVPAP